MATPRQIAANRRNAQKSTGPRSSSGKRRVSGNARRHGLSAAAPIGPEQAEQIEQLAQEFAGAHQNLIALEYARAAARAEFQLARVRQVKQELLQRIKTFGAFSPPEGPRLRIRAAMGVVNAYLITGTFPTPPDHESSLPSSEPARSAEAMARILPELLCLDRYERRAAQSRDRAIHLMLRHSRRR
jgi:hypothetical protein